MKSRTVPPTASPRQARAKANAKEPLDFSHLAGSTYVAREASEPAKARVSSGSSLMAVVKRLTGGAPATVPSPGRNPHASTPGGRLMAAVRRLVAEQSQGRRRC